jgi:hypothetical protein
MSIDTQAELEKHEAECAVRYEMVTQKLESLDKRMWRLEAMIMSSTIVVVSLAAVIFSKM